VLALRIMPSLSTLWTTKFGLLVLLKVAGFAVLLAVASRSRRVVRRSLAGSPGGTTTVTADLRKLRQAVAVEVLLSVVVLALAALLTVTPPGG